MRVSLKSQKKVAALRDLCDDDTNSALENIRKNIKLSAKKNLGQHEWKLHETLFDNKCSKHGDQRKRANLQSLQDPSQIHAANLNVNIKGIKN